MGARQPEAHAAPDQRLTSSVWTTSTTTDRGNYTYSSSRLTRGHSSCAVGCAARRDVSHGACVACACGPSGCVVQKWRVGTWDTVGVGVGESVCRISQPSLRALSDVQRATAYLQIAPLIITACSSGAGTRLTRAHHVSALAGGWVGVWLHLLFETSGRRVTVGKWASGQWAVGNVECGLK